MPTKEYVLDKSITKRPCIYEKTENMLRPIMYLQKAKSATQEEFDFVIQLITQ